jgi:hypothetical protein
MSYDEHDAAMDEMYERIGDELYPEHPRPGDRRVHGGSPEFVLSSQSNCCTSDFRVLIKSCLIAISTQLFARITKIPTSSIALKSR